MTKAQPSYDDLKQELDDILLALQQPNLDVDEAMRHYERGLELVKALEIYLKTAENKITTLQAKHKPQA